MTSLFALRDSRTGTAGRVEIGFTDGRYDVGDQAPAPVREAVLAQVEAECGARPVLMRQVHGASVRVVTASSAEASPDGVDALVAGEAGLALLTRAADCVPVLLADSDHGVIAAVHAGRPGVAAGVVPAAVARMRDLGAVDVVAWIGPHVCGSCYEVPAELRDTVAGAVPETYAVTSWGTPSLDLGAGVIAQLQAEGCAVISLERCTREHRRWPSYRRDAEAAGRFAGVIWRAP